MKTAVEEKQGEEKKKRKEKKNLGRSGGLVKR